ncbi:nucleotide exchange factor GrpE [bacterium]|nr:nucleotide exchange factor GrpE [bacterium]
MNTAEMNAEAAKESAEVQREELQDAHETLSRSETPTPDPEHVVEAGAPESEAAESKEMVPADALSPEQEDYKNRYLRLYADFENFRKRTAKERLDLVGSASKDLMQALLPVVDDFDRAFKALPDSEEIRTAVEGMGLIRHKLNDILAHKGLRSLEVQPGEAFDLERMEAIAHIPAPTDDLRGKVVDVLEQGYRLGEHVLRYARVVVGEE